MLVPLMALTPAHGAPAAAALVRPAHPPAPVATRRALLAGLAGTAALLALPTGRAWASADPSSAIAAHINAERHARGLSALAVDHRLAGVAAGWSAVLRDRGDLSHNPDREAQYGWPITGGMGEAVAVLRGPDAGSAARAVVDLWMGSDAHRRLLLGSSWTHLGIGCATAADGDLYATADLIAADLAAVGQEALALAGEMFGAGEARRVVVVRDDLPADALAAVGLVDGDVPLLLTTPGRALPAPLVQELRRVLAPGGLVHLVGGGLPGVVEAQVRDAGGIPRRLLGASRYETAAAVAEEVGRLRGTPWRVILVGGSAWADAAAAGAFSAAHGTPVLLTPREDLHPAAAQVLRALPDADRVVVGGSAVVSERVAGQAGAWRITGSDRAATGARVMLDAWATTARPGGALVVTPGWATGGWGTALAHATWSARHGAPLLYADAGLPAPVAEAVAEAGFGPAAPAALRFARDVPPAARAAFEAATR